MRLPLCLAARHRQAVLLLSVIFCGLAVLFLVSPNMGACIYGFPATAPGALFFVRAIATRDLALAAYLGGWPLVVVGGP